MTATPAPPTPAPARSLPCGRRELARLCLTAALALGLLLPLALLDRSPAGPRLTVIGGGDGLSLLLEGAGGGRVLVGGGGAQADVPALLGRQLRPWDRRLDLLLVADGRDLPGATELVRHDDVRQVAILGLEGSRAHAAALDALRDACASRAVPLRVIEGTERIHLEAADDAGLTLDVTPAPAAGEGGSLRLTAGPLVATIAAGATPGDRAPAAILLRGGQEGWYAALAARPGLVIAPAPPPASVLTGGVTSAAHLLIVPPGERATLSLEGTDLRVRGAALRPLAGVERETPKSR